MRVNTMQNEWLTIGLSAMCLVTVLKGLRQTGAPFLRRLAACFAAIIFLDALRLVLGQSDTAAQQLADLTCSAVSTFVLLKGGIDLLEADHVTLNLQRIVGGSFPAALVSHILLNFGDIADWMTPLKAMDSATSFAACVFVGLALLTRLIIREEYILGGFTVFSFGLWAIPEVYYWSEDATIASHLLMGLGGVLVAIATTMAARRRVI
jgi:hypothetical protein